MSIEISIHPSEFGILYDREKLTEHISNEVTKKISKTCTEKGFIERLKSLKVLSQYIDSITGSIVMKVEYSCVYTIPTVGSVMKGKVTAISNSGVIANCVDKFKILISAKELKEDKGFVFYDSKFVNEKTGTTIAVGSEISFKVKTVNFTNNTFTITATYS